MPTPTLRSSSDPLHTVVIGGGASGVLVAARLMDASTAHPVRVTIVEPSGRLGAGVAYGTDDPDHLVNVRASAMSADPSHPGELVEWVGNGGDGDTFVARRDYRRYLQDHLTRAVDAAADGALESVSARAVSVRIEHDGARVGLDSGEELAADSVVLALGNPPPGIPEQLTGLGGHIGFVADPWAPGALAGQRRAAQVLLVGTGLTMVDVAITLGRDHEPAGDTPLRLTGISRTGLAPMAHLERQPARPMQVVDLSLDGNNVCALAERLRARGRDGVGAEYPDENWREMIDAVRPYANALWRRFDREQKERFLSELAREWDIHRHRMAPPTARRLAVLLDDGRLRMDRARILDAAIGSDGRVRVTTEVDGTRRTDDYDAVVNCTGPGRPWSGPTPSLARSLLDSGLGVPDELGLGLSTSAEGALIDATGAPVPQVLVIGPARRGSLFETTAVPELRSQALHLADAIVGRATTGF